jgi:hypothetical protein
LKSRSFQALKTPVLLTEIQIIYLHETNIRCGRIDNLLTCFLIAVQNELILPEAVDPNSVFLRKTAKSSWCDLQIVDAAASTICKCRNWKAATKKIKTSESSQPPRANSIRNWKPLRSFCDGCFLIITPVRREEDSPPNAEGCATTLGF